MLTIGQWLVLRRQKLKANAPTECPSCKHKGIQLVGWSRRPAVWRCRVCGYDWELEPEGCYE